MNFYVTSFVVAITCLSAFAPFVEAFDGAAGLKALCHQDKDLKLTKISEALAVIRELEANSNSAEGCDEGLKNAIKDLKPVIGEGIDDICNAEKIAQIRDYYGEYIHTGEDKYAPATIKLPKALRTFVIGLGFKISALCKKNMIASVLYEAKSVLKDEDYITMASWSKNNGLMSRLFRGPSDFDDLILASELSALKASDDEQDDGLMYIKLKTSDMIRKIQVTCERRFKPIYEQLITPLVSMSNIGFNYQGPDLQKELEELSVNADINQWYKTVYLCDSVSRVVILDEKPNDADAVQTGDSKVIHVYTSEEAKAMGASNKPLDSEFPEIVAVTFAPAKNQIDDVVLDEEDKNMMKLIAKFKTDVSQFERIRKRLFKNIGDFVKDILKKGDIQIVGSMFNQENNQRNSKQDVVNAIDNYIEDSESNKQQIDGSIAGLGSQLGGYGMRVYHRSSFLGAKGVMGNMGKGFKKRHFLLFSKWFWRGIVIVLCLVVVGMIVGLIMG